MLSEEKKAELKARLEEEAVGIERELKDVEKAPDFGSDVTEPEDEEADEAEETATNISIADALKQRLQEIHRALGKLQTGGYGTCEKCGGEIDEELLSKNPESALCRNCKLAEK